MKKVEILHDHMVKEVELSEDFLASTGWIKRFTNRYGFSLQRKSSTA